jgi:Peroxisomal biogenesis factor 11 (PEX11)
MLTSSANTDTALLTVGYTFYLIHALLARLENAQLHVAAQNLALRLAALAPKSLLPGETVIATISASPTSRLVRGKQSAKNLATLISGYRMFMRLLGLPKIWSWAVATWRNPPSDPLLRYITWVQVAACASFQYLENGAYLAANGVIAMEPERIGRRFQWSARFWAVHVFLQFITLGRRRQLELQSQKAVEKRDPESDAAAVKTQAKWWRDIYVNAAWAPLTIHWSTSGYMPDEGIAALCLTAGWLGIRQAWIAAA